MKLLRHPGSSISIQAVLMEKGVQLGQQDLVLSILEDNLSNGVLHLERLDSSQVFACDPEVFGSKAVTDDSLSWSS